MAESRQELLHWINNLTGLGLVKIEELGKGYALCQIFDSVFLDVPLRKVKFNAKHEFEYIQNFKVLQSVFDKHKIPNHIPVERLVKLKFQDNIEFCQFVKKFWDSHFPGHFYDAAARRAGAGAPAVVASAGPAKVSARATAGGAASMGARVKASSSPSLAGGLASAGSASNVSAAALQHAQVQVAELQGQLDEAHGALESMAKERDFYFGKLRAVEVMMQALQQQGEAAVEIQAVLDTLYAPDAPEPFDAAASAEPMPDDGMIESF
ncbi:microtubule integrity protein mal3 [Blastocladiella emersonii ATCC 22665]|nr:microtubule integrity protein mal3 [Blastocladiella emersonii ATCC 22665]